MGSGQLIATALSALALSAIGVLALLWPDLLRQAAMKATVGTRDIPAARRVWYEWARSKYYIRIVRVLGFVALTMAVVLFGAIIARGT